MSHEMMSYLPVRIVRSVKAGGIGVSTMRERIEQAESENLSPGAARSAESKGRVEAEEPHPYRTSYQRDRDRVLHSKSFRRLAHKTQAFLAPEGDHYRVRLTHSLEVAQIARTIARALRLNEDLAEAICLGHDLGHTPFGHLGEEVLTEFLGRPFRHNEQSLRVVETLEVRSSDPAKTGLNLTWEVRDGILNHTWSYPEPATLEAQVARYADRIAYVNHDLDDSVRAGVVTIGDLPEGTNRVLGTTSSQRIDAMVGAVVDASNDERILMSPDVNQAMLTSREFLFERVYLRQEVRPELERAKALVRALCDHYTAHSEDLPQGEAHEDLEVRLIDYIAGMTDRFARREYERIFGGGA